MSKAQRIAELREELTWYETEWKTAKGLLERGKWRARYMRVKEQLEQLER